MIVDVDGKLASYELSQVSVDEPQPRSGWIPAKATQSLGQNVLITDTAEIE